MRTNANAPSRRKRTLPALEAGHIKPFSEGGIHEPTNGLLLRRDIHALFDSGYVTVTPDLKFHVSRRIKEEFEKTQPVASKKPNAWGLYDMRGNVAEWVQDWYDAKYYAKSPMSDPKGPDSSDGGRGARGGTFHEGGPSLERVSLRLHFPEAYRNFDHGFWVVS